MTGLLLNEHIYQHVVQDRLPDVRRYLWILTADLKDLHVKRNNRFVPLLDVLAALVARGVDVRLIHAKEPGPRFRQDFDRHPELIQSDQFERILCPRMHMKVIIGDGRWAFIGSANFTGAGLGAKHPDRRNFEAGWLTEDPAVIAGLLAFTDRFYLGDHCRTCRLRDICPEPLA